MYRLTKFIHLYQLIKNTIYNSYNKNFLFFYNLISRLHYHSQNYLTNDGEKFILNEKNFKWSFSYKQSGFFLSGIWKKGKQLHKEYKIEDIKFMNMLQTINYSLNNPNESPCDSNFIISF